MGEVAAWGKPDEPKAIVDLYWRSQPLWSGQRLRSHIRRERTSPKEDPQGTVRADCRLFLRHIRWRKGRDPERLWPDSVGRPGRTRERTGKNWGQSASGIPRISPLRKDP